MTPLRSVSDAISEEILPVSQSSIDSKFDQSEFSSHASRGRYRISDNRGFRTRKPLCSCMFYPFRKTENLFCPSSGGSF